MVHGGFPGAALVTQLFRQLTKPMSERIVAYAARHPHFRRYLLVAPGRLYHRIRINLEQIKNGVNGKPLASLAKKKISEDEAVEVASQLMIEVVIFAILVLLMTCDYVRSQLRAAAAEENRQREFEQLAERKAEVAERLLRLRQQTEQLRGAMARLRDELDE